MGQGPQGGKRKRIKTLTPHFVKKRKQAPSDPGAPSLRREERKKEEERAERARRKEGGGKNVRAMSPQTASGGGPPLSLPHPY